MRLPISWKVDTKFAGFVSIWSKGQSKQINQIGQSNFGSFGLLSMSQVPTPKTYTITDLGELKKGGKPKSTDEKLFSILFFSECLLVRIHRPNMCVNVNWSILTNQILQIRMFPYRHYWKHYPMLRAVVVIGLLFNFTVFAKSGKRLFYAFFNINISSVYTTKGQLIENVIRHNLHQQEVCQNNSCFD